MGKDFDLEKLALRLLCAGTQEGALRDDIMPPLRGYAWQSMLHQAIFDAVAAIPCSDLERLRQLLPAKLTRMGFPDVDWADLFAPSPMTSEEAVSVVRKLLAGA